MTLTDIEYVKRLKTSIRTSLETDSGKDVIEFLESLCGWYDFKERDPNMIMLNHGKRQVLATLKTLINLKAEQIVEIAKSQEA